MPEFRSRQLLLISIPLTSYQVKLWADIGQKLSVILITLQEERLGQLCICKGDLPLIETKEDINRIAIILYLVFDDTNIRSHPILIQKKGNQLSSCTWMLWSLSKPILDVAIGCTHIMIVYITCHLSLFRGKELFR